uniref:Uncharacterized protein n=1 Tax=Lymantria dispar multicapsid nuclear polyhedrosis virus TaxID=10449 RepID=A0A140HR54_NPVLD|nr:hypothetical protein [Lymantria dispar multiple nucleopolyhedrovirus]
MTDGRDARAVVLKRLYLDGGLSHEVQGLFGGEPIKVSVRPERLDGLAYHALGARGPLAADVGRYVVQIEVVFVALLVQEAQQGGGRGGAPDPV